MRVTGEDGCYPRMTATARRTWCTASAQSQSRTRRGGRARRLLADQHVQPDAQRDRGQPTISPRAVKRSVRAIGRSSMAQPTACLPAASELTPSVMATPACARRATHQWGRRLRYFSFRRGNRASRRSLPLGTITTRLAARGGRLHRPGDPRAGPRDADVAGHAAASVGHRTAASRGETNGRTAPTQAVPWHDRSTTAAASCRLCLCHGFARHAVGSRTIPFIVELRESALLQWRPNVMPDDAVLTDSEQADGSRTGRRLGFCVMNAIARHIVAASRQCHGSASA
jgi:hypothetical protein